MVAGTAITVAEYTETALPCVMGSGTPKRRMMVFLRATVTHVGETAVMTAYNSNIADIEGIVYATDDGANASTYPTWSTAKLTTTMAGVEEYCIMVTMT